MVASQMISTSFSVALFGMLGVLSRYFTERHVGTLFTTEFPVATFAINCVGSFLIGLIMVAANEAELISKDLSLAMTVGFLGGFTTFSAFSFQTFQLLEKGQILLAASYFFGSPISGLICAAAGFYLARALWG